MTALPQPGSLARPPGRPGAPCATAADLPRRRIAYVYVLPFFLVFLAFSVYPWLATAWVSLHDIRLSTYHQSSWIGLDNYRNLFTNKFFWNALPQHHHDRDHLDGPAAVHGAGHRPPAQLPPPRADVLPGRDADALRHQPGRRDGDLRRAVRPQPRPGQLDPARAAPADRRLAGLEVAVARSRSRRSSPGAGPATTR